MPTAYLTVSALFLAALVARDRYELRKARGTVDTRDSRVFGAVVLAMCVMWASWFAMGLLDPLAVPVPDAVRWFGSAVVALGLGLVFGGMLQLRGVENIDHLVTTGLYSLTRHPMYSGFVLLIVGWAVRQGAVVSLAIGSFGLASILWWRLLEERDMGSAWGQRYAEYRARTWI